jgi:hypothetical protein
MGKKCEKKKDNYKVDIKMQGCLCTSNYVTLTYHIFYSALIINNNDIEVRGNKYFNTINVAQPPFMMKWLDLGINWISHLDSATPHSKCGPASCTTPV